MNIEELACPGCYVLKPKKFSDNRGNFVKTFHYENFRNNNISIDIREEFYSVSYKDVIRGLHFQEPPSDHMKHVYCLQGEIKDVFVDLRKGSPTFGKSFCVLLNEENCMGLFLPKGIAHGFVTLSEKAVVVYKTTCEYNSELDKGILWSSIDFNWDVNAPIVSLRDSGFPSLQDYCSPFIYKCDKK